MRGTGGGLSTLQFVQIKTGSEVPLTRVRNAWLENERTHITEVFTDTGQRALGGQTQKGGFFLLLLDGQHGINLLLDLQSVPLGDGSPGVGQHVWPVSQLRAGAVVAHKDFADGVVLADLVIVQDRHHHLHFLEGDTKRTKGQPALRMEPWELRIPFQSNGGGWKFVTLEMSAQIFLFCLYMMVTGTPIIVVTTILLPFIWGWGGPGLMLLRPASSQGAAPDLFLASPKCWDYRSVSSCLMVILIHTFWFLFHTSYYLNFTEEII